MTASRSDSGGALSLNQWHKHSGIAPNMELEWGIGDEEELRDELRGAEESELYIE